MSILYTYMILGLPEQQADYQYDILLDTPRFQQRNAFLALCDLLTLFRRLHPEPPVCGFQFSFKGKIGRAGSARKQKLLYQEGGVYRTEMDVATYMTQRQLPTPTGALGITKIISYKDV